MAPRGSWAEFSFEAMVFSRFRVQGLGSRVQGLGSRVQGLGPLELCDSRLEHWKRRIRWHQIQNPQSAEP